jgi:hypothetical protein
MTLNMTPEEKIVYQRERQSKNYQAWKSRQIEAGVYTQKKNEYKLTYYRKIIQNSERKDS